MLTERNFSIKHLNTFGIDARADRYVRFDHEAEIGDFLRHESLKEGEHLVLGGGSNLLFVDDFPGTLLHPVFRGISIVEEDNAHVWVRAMAGETWDDLVAFTVSCGYGGIENLSLIPGNVGASAVQNIGAYGVEAESAIERVEAIHLASGERTVFSGKECEFGYRTSRFKKEGRDQYLITAVVFRLSRQPRFVLDYPGVRDAVSALGDICLATVRQAIIAIRKSKLPDPAVTGNAGSFFKNPVVEKDVLEPLLARFPDMPHYPQPDGRVKLAAGWLIDQCGWKGRSLGRAAVHNLQALVLVNLGGATGREILALSEQIQLSVEDAFDIDLECEVRVVD